MQLVNALREAKRILALTEPSNQTNVVSVSVHIQDPEDKVIYSVVYNKPGEDNTPLVSKLFPATAGAFSAGLFDNAQRIALEASHALQKLGVVTDK
jgi:hypothetical protein